jgi:hypothetical protein
MPIELPEPLVFEWDAGNQHKNRLKHDVIEQEAEQIFLNTPLYFTEDILHSDVEDRYLAFGKTDIGRLLSVSYTIRGKHVRVIMARPMSRKERSWYEAQSKS